MVDVLVSRAITAAKEYGYKKLAIAGGVASNSALRAAMKEACDKNGITFYHPSPIFCPDDPLRSHFSLSFFSEKFTQKCVLIFLFLTSVLEASILPPSCQNDLETVVHIKLIFQNL